MRIESLLGESAGMRKVRAQVAAAAASQANVLIRGRRGTGREHVARAIHYQASESRARGDRKTRASRLRSGHGGIVASSRRLGPRSARPEAAQHPALAESGIIAASAASAVAAVFGPGVARLAVHCHDLTVRCSRANRASRPGRQSTAAGRLVHDHDRRAAACRTARRFAASGPVFPGNREPRKREAGRLGATRCARPAAPSIAGRGNSKNCGASSTPPMRQPQTHEITPADLPPIVHHAAKAAAAPRRAPEKIVLDELLESIEREVITPRWPKREAISRPPPSCSA